MPRTVGRALSVSPSREEEVMKSKRCRILFALTLFIIAAVICLTSKSAARNDDKDLDRQLSRVLRAQGFTGRIESTLEQRLGRKIDKRLADLGRNLFHDTIVGLNNDNSCSGCHAATAGFGDTQSIAIGIENNFIVGPDRSGPRNQRRTPMAANTAFFAKAIAEFEFTLSFANAPIDRFARGEDGAMTEDQKKGALLFFGEARCVACHAVSGQSNEMFSDFNEHVIGVPQIAPIFGNVTFDGPGRNEDFGLEQVTGNPNDRYMFRTSPIRNVALQPAFFHNGCFTRLDDAIHFHLNVTSGARNYDPVRAGVKPDLQGPAGPIEPVLARLDPLMQTSVILTKDEFRQLVDFLRNGLLDDDARPEKLRRLIPTHVPSGRAIQNFQ